MKFNLTKDEAKEILKNSDYKKIPLSTIVDADNKTPADIYRVLKSVSNNVFLLESAEDNKNWGRYSFMGYDPKLEITCLNHTVRINAGTSFEISDKKPHEYIRQILDENKSVRLPDHPTFTGGLVGYFSYDFIKYNEESLQLDANDDEAFNDVDLMFFDKVIVFDNLLNTIMLIANIDAKTIDVDYNRGIMSLENMAQMLNQQVSIEENGTLTGPLNPLFSKEQYCSFVQQAKNHIYEGDIFQVVLSNRWSAPFTGSLFGTYQNLRETNPSPYMFYFSSNDVEIAGASPETLVKLENNKVCTFPLAGTRPRGKTQDEDLALEKELLADEKECSEHNMLVDLGRNDLGKICKFGSVHVDEYMKIERFSHVMHIGSTVSGEIKEDKDALDAIDAVLPAGTLSGAPKIRACEIINQLENNKRGIYGGAIGYLDFTGNADVCIAIRLAFKKNGKVFVRSGAGIVADSVPEKEHEECLAKAKAVVNALEGK